jgi:hypothetical protein
MCKERMANKAIIFDLEVHILTRLKKRNEYIGGNSSYIRSIKKIRAKNEDYAREKRESEV